MEVRLRALAILLVLTIGASLAACGPSSGGGPAGLPGGVSGAATQPPAATVATSPTPTNPELPPKPHAASVQLRILTQQRGDPVRTQILDTLRNDPQMGSERGGRFVVSWLALQDGWAMFQGETEGKNTPVEALLRKEGGGWTVVDFQTTNGTRISHARFPDAPGGVFGPAFSLAPRAVLTDQLQILTNDRGNPTRTAILDALRTKFTPDTKFSVQWLRAKGGWAYFTGVTKPNDMPLDAMLKHGPSGWRVLVVQGEGDFPESIPQMYAAEAPRSIFP